jgi:hypothetical protein
VGGLGAATAARLVLRRRVADGGGRTARARRRAAGGGLGGAGLERARRHSEAGPLTAPPRSELAFALYAAERWQEAQGLFRRLAAQSPSDLDLKGRLGVLAASGRSARPPPPTGPCGVPAALPLRPPHTLAGAHRRPARPGHRARSSCCRGLRRGPGLRPGLHSDPDLEPLRAHPRFQALVRPRG